MNAQTQAAPQPLSPHVLEVVRSAQQELAELIRRRTEIMKRMGTIKQTLAGLANLFGDSILADELVGTLGRGPVRQRSGFTRACRIVLMEAHKPLRIRQVCDGMRTRFPELVARHKDLAASVTTVLNRLVDYAEASTYFDEQGMRVWAWVSDEQPLVTETIATEIKAEDLLAPVTSLAAAPQQAYSS